MCYGCGKEEAAYCVENDVLSPCSPCYYCSSCLQRFHYSEKNRLITKPFSMSPLSPLSSTNNPT